MNANSTSRFGFALTLSLCQHCMMTAEPDRASARGGAEKVADGARRKPVQQRSADTCRRIEEAAARLLAQGGSADALTTFQLAKEAGVSVGALYRFFPDKEAIIDAVALRRLGEFEAVLTTDLQARSAFVDGPEFLNYMLGMFIDFLGNHPDFRTVLYGPGHISETFRRRHFGHDAAAAQLARRHVARRLGWAESSALKLRWEMLAEVAMPLIGFITAQSDPEKRSAATRELQRLLTRWLLDDPAA